MLLANKSESKDETAAKEKEKVEADEGEHKLVHHGEVLVDDSGY